MRAIDDVDRVASPRRVTTVAAAITSVLLAMPATAGPEGEAVVHGDVTFIREGGRTVIQASDGSIINYLSFDVAPHELVQFVQPGELSRVLNRITGGDPSSIQGTLQANGIVYFVNPAGVMFGPDAVVDVGGIYAAAGAIQDADFLEGIDAFNGMQGAVVNEGFIRGDRVFLIGRHVANHGEILSPSGVITMVAGDDVLIRRHGERVTVKVDGEEIGVDAAVADGATAPDLADDPGVVNTGVADAGAGQIVLGAGDLYSMAIRNAGQLVAENGTVTVAALDGVVENSGAIAVAGGGAVVHGPSVVNAGSITADAGEAAGAIEVRATNHLYLLGGSRVSASGGSGDADGGTAVLISTEGVAALASDATIDVAGGALGGDGGFAELSGRDLIFNGDVRLQATAGHAHGTFLLDPASIFINDEGEDDAFLADGMIDFGEPDPFDDLSISDEALEAIVGDIILQATEGIHVNQQVDFVNGNSLVLEANGAIYVHEPINGAMNLSLLADADGNGSGNLKISNPLDVAGSATFSGATILHNTGLLVTGGTQTYLTPVDLCIDTELRGSGIVFEDVVDATNAGEQSLTLVGPTEFHAAVGGLRALGSLTVNGPSSVDAGVILTAGHQRYLDDMTLRSDLETRSLQEGEILFSAIDGAFALDARTGGVTRFEGDAGGTTRLTRISTDEPGSTRLDGDLIAGIVDLDDDVTLDGAVTLSATGSVELAGTVDGRGNDLSINAPLTTLDDDATDLGAFTTDSAGRTRVGADVAGRRISFQDPVDLIGDARITGAEEVDFRSTIDGVHDLVVHAGGELAFGGDIGGERRLESLTASAGDLIRLGLGRVLATGDIRFNPEGGGGAVPATATIAARTDSLHIASLEGDVTFGADQKLTVVGADDGDLLIEAPAGRVTLGDLSTLGDMVIDAMFIDVITRPAGDVLRSDGDVVLDGGVDFVAGGVIDFSTAPSVVGDGPAPRFATPDGSMASATLDGFEVLPFGEIERRIFFFGATVLDLDVTGGGVTPGDDGGDEGDDGLGGDGNDVSLASAIGGRPPVVRDIVLLEPFADRALDHMAMHLRPMDAAELLATTEGRELYDDTPRSARAATGLPLITVNRLRRETVLSIMQRHAALFSPEQTDPATGERHRTDQRDRIRAALGDAWERYQRDTPIAERTARADAFRAYLASAPDQAEALRYLDDLRDLVGELGIVGATNRELRICLNGMLAPITPPDMAQDDLEQALGVDLFAGSWPDGDAGAVVMQRGG